MAMYSVVMIYDYPIRIPFWRCHIRGLSGFSQHKTLLASQWIALGLTLSSHLGPGLADLVQPGVVAVSFQGPPADR